MLDIKQPETETGGHRHHGELHEKPGTKAVDYAHTDAPTGKGDVHEMYGLPLFLFGFGIWEALKDDEQHDGCEHEQDDGVAYESVT